ncbi:hypothetical protein DK880_00764 [Candidatus Cardinium hertigii]|uniref:Cystathionine beta-lyase n=1 Tax=Candidatus Cardinium hertigii TaxID=247481 RepID=A0A2Z3L942_9BACT|nr:hypothetical protein DK880_00764 [Candidatus Cardinium hertigii]
MDATESLVSCLNTMSNSHMTPEQLQTMGIKAGFMRLSCGIEDAQELIEALDRTLGSCKSFPRLLSNWMQCLPNSVLKLRQPLFCMGRNK